jgi:hypothetical protein
MELLYQYKSQSEIKNGPKDQLWWFLASSKDPELWTEEWTGVRELQSSKSRQLGDLSG